MCWTAPPIKARDSVISLPAADAACCESLAARSISRLPATMVCAALCNPLNCSDSLATRAVTSSRLPATSANSTPREPMRDASSLTSSESLCRAAGSCTGSETCIAFNIAFMIATSKKNLYRGAGAGDVHRLRQGTQSRWNLVEPQDLHCSTEGRRFARHPPHYGGCLIL